MAKVSVSRDPDAAYTAPEACGPPENFPELQGNAFGAFPGNRVYPLVRRCLAEYGCDAARFGTPEWNPFGRWIHPGARVFILPNLVMHRRPWEPRARFQAQCTNASVLRPIIDYCLLAAGPTGSVAIGSAPVHGSDFPRSAAEAGSSTLGAEYRSRGLRVEGPLDLRKEGEHDDPGIWCCHIDLGGDSLLDTHWHQGAAAPVYRVGTYHPDLTASFHGPGRHVYLVDRRILQADVVISVPKLKMHSKVGLTCSLKGAVGSVTHKGCLAHFRAGTPGEYGDEFPAGTAAARSASWFNDIAARTSSWPGGRLVELATRVGVRIARSMPSGVIGGNWPGNDTCWRMALDLSRILMYGRPDGTMAQKPARSHLILIDGVVAGEGDGPLHATPRNAGIVLFGSDPCAVDTACGYVMGLDPLRIPLVAESFSPHRYPLTDDPLGRVELTLDGSPSTADALTRLLDPAPRPARGWEGCCYQPVS